MTLHDLKCWPESFEPLRDGRKTFEIRRCLTLVDSFRAAAGAFEKLERDYRVGDVLVLRPHPEGVAERLQAYVRDRLEGGDGEGLPD